MDKPNITIYDLDNKKVITSVYLPHKETILGFVATSYPILKDLEKYSKRKVVVYASINMDDYTMAKNIEYENIIENTLGKLKIREYGQWIKSGGTGYNMYKFNTPHFYQGIMAICDYYNVDFRDYIKGCCFDKMGNNYSLDGYIMFNAQLYPYIEDDNDDTEDKDNENLIPLLRDENY